MYSRRLFSLFFSTLRICHYLIRVCCGSGAFNTQPKLRLPKCICENLLILRQYIQDCELSSSTFEAFLLLGLLANYNKFEYRNPYRTRLEDFVNESTIQRIVQGFGNICSQSMNMYAAIEDDVPEGWTLSSTLTYIGLGVLAPIKAISPIAISADTADEQFAAL